jgi:hypothetical protein
MGKKPVIGLAALWLTSAALVGCQDCQHCCGGRCSSPSSNAVSQQPTAWSQTPTKGTGRAPAGDMDSKAVASQGMQAGAGASGTTTSTWPPAPSNAAPSTVNSGIERTSAVGIEPRQTSDSSVMSSSVPLDRTPSAGMNVSQPVDPTKGRTTGVVDGTSNYRGDAQLPTPVVNVNKNSTLPAGQIGAVPEPKAPMPSIDPPAPPVPGSRTESNLPSAPPPPDPPPGSESRMTPPAPPGDFVPMPPRPFVPPPSSPN